MPDPALKPLPPPLFTTDESGRVHSRITLRDLFAATAMNGYLAMHSDTNCGNPNSEKIAQTAYMIADAMLAAREAK